MTEPSTQGRKAGLIPAAALTLTLLLAGCRPDPPQPPPSTPPGTSGLTGTSPPAPSPSEPAARSVHFTAQGDIGVSTGARKVLDTIAGLRPELNLALGDFSYKAGIEQEFCDMVTGSTK